MPEILSLDIECQRGIAETWDPTYPSYIPMDRVKVPPRILCFAAKWYGKKTTMFHAAWEDDDTDAFADMVMAAHELLSAADVLTTWNGDRYDVQYLNAAFGRLGLGPPAPYRSLDLIKVVKKNFKKGEPYQKLDWYSQEWLGDRKVRHGATDLWDDIRYGDDKVKRAAQRLMRKYNVQDVLLTEQLFERFLPWTGVNFALYGDGAAEPEACTKCSSDDIHRRGFFYTTACKYQRYRCNACGSWSRGKRMVYTTELRPV